MANITETETWDDGVYQLETTDPVEGGADGVDNAPHKNLANRTLWLKNNKADKNGNAANKFKVANAVATDEAVNLAQLNTKANLAGSAANKFKVANATATDEAVNLAQLNTKANLAGSATNKFKVANATATDEAVNLAQLNTKANLAGSATQKFKVANATAADEAVSKKQLEDILASFDTMPTGSIITYPVNNIPAGFLECNGASLSKTTYADLFAKIGTTYGSTSTTFKLPDLRGEFIRGFDNGRGVDSGRTIGTSQADDFKSHNHTFSGRGIGRPNPNLGTTLNNENLGSNMTDMSNFSIGSSGGSETRPRNIAMMYCIKY